MINNAPRTYKMLAGTKGLWQSSTPHSR
uniref:Uncharacterized protein n=1 Tax=Anguilla anguilla TaxID=7936 RepID=A0A0E9UUD3_ANGAN